MTNGQDENCFRMRSSPQIAKKAATDPVAGPTASTDQPWASRWTPVEFPKLLASGERRQAEQEGEAGSRSVNRCSHAHSACKFPMNVTAPVSAIKPHPRFEMDQSGGCLVVWTADACSAAGSPLRNIPVSRRPQGVQGSAPGEGCASHVGDRAESEVPEDLASHWLAMPS
jgi:hypothetical protein